MGKQKLDTEIYGHPIYVDETGMFYCEIGGNEFKSYTLQRLFLDVEESGIVEINIEAYNAHSYGGIERVLIERLCEYNQTRVNVKPLEGTTCSGDRELKELYPITPENTKVYEEHKRMRENGWKLIKQADRLASKLEPFPDNFFKKYRGGRERTR